MLMSLCVVSARAVRAWALLVLVHSVASSVRPRTRAWIRATAVAPRTADNQGYTAPPHLRTWKPFNYATTVERRAAARAFARELSARHERSVDDPLPPLPPLRIFLLGGPSCGKGTLAPMLSAAFRARVLGVGQLLRGEIRALSARAMVAAEVMAQGKLLPDEFVLELLSTTVTDSRDVLANGWLLDGFPRTLGQAQAVLSRESLAHLRPDCVIVVDRPDELVLEFALGRMCDSATGAHYHPIYAPPPEEALVRLVWRVDDTPEIVRARLAEHQRSIAPILAAFAAAGVPMLSLDNARSELATFEEAAAFIEGVGVARLESLGGRDAFRATAFGELPLEDDVATLCDVDELESECLQRYEQRRFDNGQPEDPLLEAVRRCNRFDPNRFVPVLVGDDRTIVGWASTELVGALSSQIAAGCAAQLLPWAGDDGLGSRRARGSAPGRQPGSSEGAVALCLAPGVTGRVERTTIVAALVDELIADGVIAAKSVRSELQDVWPAAQRPVQQQPGAGLSQRPSFRLERAAMTYFGIPAYGVHLNGYVTDETTGAPSAVWVARRSMSKATYPGLFDQMVAGGQPAGLSFLENMRKEASEEASLPPELAARAQPAGCVTYRYGTRKGLSTKCLVTFDLEMPAGLVPVNCDGEVDEFVLMPVAEALDSIRTRLPLWKPNAALVMIAFAVRHGFITADLPCYEELVDGLLVDGWIRQ